jgi:hypothetical protein
MKRQWLANLCTFFGFAMGFLLGCSGDDDHTGQFAGSTQVATTNSAGISAIGGAGATQATATGGSVATTNAAGKSGTKATGGKGGSAGTSGKASPTAGKSAAGAGGSAGSGASGQANPVCTVTDPSKFQANLSVGGGGTNYKESDHFVLFNASNPDTILNFMEAAEKCFVQDWCWRSSGISTHSSDTGPFYKTNIYSIAMLSAGGYTSEDQTSGLSYIQMLSAQASDPKSTVHEYGHALTIAAKNWINQKNTGFWWESVANFVAYTFLTSPYCEAARNKYKIAALTTIIDQMNTLSTVYGQSYAVICNSQNYYQAWPFFTYLTNNPDNYPGLGRMVLPDLFKNHKGNNETPLHELDRMASPVKVQTILGRYWARMAYMDIRLPVAQQDFLKSRSSLNFAANLDSAGNQTYKVKASRQPQYGGANITPLKVSGSGEVSVKIANLGNGLQESNFTATLAIRSNDGSVRYVDLPKGSGQATVGTNEEASLVVVNTPDTLYMYDPQYVGSPETTGLNYQVQITGAAPTN